MTNAIFYIIEPPRYASLAAPLLASLREFIAPETRIFAYCPAALINDIPAATVELHRRLGAEIRSFDTEGKWKTPYPHGNKILAALDDRGCDFSLFLDTDIIFTRPTSLADYLHPGAVCASPATAINWGGDAEWQRIYDHLGLPLPDYRIHLSRKRKKWTFLPYFNAGMIGFPEKMPNGQSFARHWYDLALRIDDLDGIDGKRPYLDQMSLPPAILSSGLVWRCIDETAQYILGGRIRGKPLPETGTGGLHYRYPEFLSEIGAHIPAVAVLQKHCGDLPLSELLLDPNWFAPAP